jgi:hypothetical protein
MPAIFITSTGRTGTWFITRLVNEAVENAWSLHEPKPHFKREGWELLKNQPTKWHAVYFKWPRQWRQLQHAEQWYVESNYHLFACIPLIRQVWPGATIVHVVRDGRPVVRSWLNRNRYLGHDHIKPAFFPDSPIDEKTWQSWNPVQKNAWYWQAINSFARQQEPDYLLSFEQMFYPPYKDLYTLLDIMPDVRYQSRDVESMLNERINKTQHSFFPYFEEWPLQWREQFWSIAGKEMAALGYS